MCRIADVITEKNLETFIGEKVKKSELKEIFGVYMILLDAEQLPDGDVEGILVYAGDGEDEAYEKWFKQTRPIAPILNMEDYEYDED